MPYDATDVSGLKITPETRKVLEEARALIKRGWCRGTEKRHTGGFLGLDPHYQYCIIGAVREASKTVTPTDPETYTDAHTVLQDTLNGSSVFYHPLVDFNDHDASKRDVLKLFDKVLAQ